MPGPCPILTRSGTLGSSRRFLRATPPPRTVESWAEDERSRSSSRSRRSWRPAAAPPERASPPRSQPGDVAVVGSTHITKAQLDHQIKLDVRAIELGGESCTGGSQGQEDCGDKRGSVPPVGTEAYRTAIVQPVVTYLVLDAQLHAIGRNLSIVVTPEPGARRDREEHPAAVRRGRGQVPRRPGEVQADGCRRAPAGRALAARAAHRREAEEPGDRHAAGGRGLLHRAQGDLRGGCGHPRGVLCARAEQGRRRPGARGDRFGQELCRSRLGGARRQLAARAVRRDPRRGRPGVCGCGVRPADERALAARAGGQRLHQIAAVAQGQVQAGVLLRHPPDRRHGQGRIAEAVRGRAGADHAAARLDPSAAVRPAHHRQAREAAEQGDPLRARIRAAQADDPVDRRAGHRTRPPPRLPDSRFLARTETV